MPERVENLLDSRLNDGRESVADKLQRESELLRDGLSAGALHRLNEMYENPGSTALGIAGCTLLGAGMNLASRTGGRWGTAAKIATYGFGIALGVDVLRRGIPTVGAMADTWSSPSNLDYNKRTVAGFAGTALIDYPLMFASGYAGYRIAGRIPTGALASPSTIAGEVNLDPSAKLQTRAVALEPSVTSRVVEPRSASLTELLAQDPATKAARVPEVLATVAAAKPRVIADGLTGPADPLNFPRTLPDGSKPSGFLPEIADARPASLTAAPNPTVEPATLQGCSTGSKLGWRRFSDEVSALLDQPFNEPSVLDCELASPVAQPAPPLSLTSLDAPGALTALAASRAGGALTAPRSLFMPSTIPADMMRFAGVGGQSNLAIHATTQGKLIDRVRPVLSNTEPASSEPSSEPSPSERTIVAGSDRDDPKDKGKPQDPTRESLKAKIREALNQPRR